MIKKLFTNKNIKAAGNRIIEFVISDETIDRDNEIIIAEGCDFTEFAKNPQFLGFHDSWNYPLAKPISWAIDKAKKQVTMKVYFPTFEELSSDQNNMSEHAKDIDLVYHLYLTKMLNAVSVGFIPLESNYETMNGDQVRTITSWQLIEVSAVPIPANPNALQKAEKEYLTENLKSYMEAIKMAVQTKTGKKLSAETQETLKGFHGSLTEATGKMKAAHKDMETACMKMAAFLDENKDMEDDAGNGQNANNEPGTDTNKPQDETPTPDKDFVLTLRD